MHAVLSCNSGIPSSSQNWQCSNPSRSSCTSRSNPSLMCCGKAGHAGSPSLGLGSPSIATLVQYAAMLDDNSGSNSCIMMVEHVGSSTNSSHSSAA